MKRVVENKYVLVPIDDEMGNSDDILVGTMMDIVAKNNGCKNIKIHIRKKLGLSGTSIKNITKTIIYPRAISLDEDNYPLKDAYKCVRKIDVVHYAEVMNVLIKEFDQIAQPHQRAAVLEYISKWNLNPGSYQRALCNKVLDGFDKVATDENTANCINRISNTRAICESIKKELLINEIEVKR